MSLDLQQKQFVSMYSGWLDAHLAELRQFKMCSEVLFKSQEYSLLSAGKRFRPFLTYLVYSLFSSDYSKIKNFSFAVEMIHTYSLIHDDLPCMDNDDLRRGQPTNHKVFSEEVALLAGDGLLTDAFFMVSSDQSLDAEIKIKLITLLSDKAGSTGMVGGQALDMLADKNLNLQQLKKIHTLKTANLIEAAAMGGALAAQANQAELHNISKFSHALGMAFQIKDDLLDVGDKGQDYKSYVALLGLEKTAQELQTYSTEARQALGSVTGNKALLIELINYNLKRDA